MLILAPQQHGILTSTVHHFWVHLRITNPFHFVELQNCLSPTVASLKITVGFSRVSYISFFLCLIAYEGLKLLSPFIIGCLLIITITTTFLKKMFLHYRIEDSFKNTLTKYRFCQICTWLIIFWLRSLASIYIYMQNLVLGWNLMFSN